VSSAGVALAAALALAAAGDVELKLDVNKDGLKWTGACKATVFHADKYDGDAQVLSHDDVSEPLSLSAGAYHVVVSCPSTEGNLALTVPVRATGRSVNKRVKLRPGFVLTEVFREDVPTDAHLTFIDKHGREVQQGQVKVAIPVAPGRYTLHAQVATKKGQRPVMGTTSITVRAGKKIKPVVDTSDGKLLIELRNNGKKVEGVGALRLPRTPKRLREIGSDQETAASPGTYDLITQISDSHDFAEVVKKDVTIRPGKTTRVKVNHTTGQLAPRLVRDGRTLKDTPASVELFLGAAPNSFNTLDAGEIATLQPGRYRVRAKLSKEKLDDGSLVEGEATATVRARQKATVKIDLSAANLEVKTSLGGEAKALKVEVFKEGGKAPVAKKKSDAKGAASFRLPPGKYRVAAVLKATQGPVLAEQKVLLKRGRTAKKKLDLEVGRAVVQVFEDGIAVAAEVLFYAGAAAEPILGVPAGQDAYLPAGSYTLSVRRRGKVRTFAPIRVAPGRVVERQVELAEDKGEQPEDGESGPAKP
jgi:hypothetical protein